MDKVKKVKINSVSLDYDLGFLFITVFVDDLDLVELSDNARVTKCKGLRLQLPNVADMPVELALAMRAKRCR